MLAQVPSGPSAAQLEQLRVSRDWRDWLFAAVLLATALVVSWLVRRVITRAVRRGDGDELGARLVGRLITYVIMIVGIVAALGSLQVRGLGAVLAALGVFGVAIAFAMKDILENLISGMFLQMSRPFRRGDTVSTAGFEGTIEDITLRTVQLTSFDGELVLIPSATVYKNPITNFTRMGRRRALVDVTVPHDIEVERAKSVALAAVRSLGHVRADPEPAVLVTSFAGGGTTLSVRAWFDTADVGRAVVGDAMACALKAAYDEAGIPLCTPPADS